MESLYNKNVGIKSILKVMDNKQEAKKKRKFVGSEKLTKRIYM